MNTDYFSYNKHEKIKDRMEDRDPLWLMNEEVQSNRRSRGEPSIQWGLIEENNKPSLYTTTTTTTASKVTEANTEPLPIPNNGSRDTHKTKKNKQMAYTFPYINNETTTKFDEWTKKEKRKSQPTFLFTVGSLQKEEPVPWPANLVTRSHDKQRRRQHRSNGYNKSGYDEEDLIFTMEDDD